ncbi:glycosyltransferase [Priestia aryabhattai]|uniref:glycosyltransferase n=1 Tax=Priestia aryabhattai TaxID=412384 RepID=UPI001C0E5FD0|nr:glycosyltransferase [Priestia aryabhattai]MBU3570695.1 glycosyltransferase [Priestia aryabhattai]
MSKKIMFFVPSLGIGGAQKVASFVINSYSENGHKLTVVSYDRADKAIKFDSRINVIELNGSWGKSKSKIYSLLEKFKTFIGAKKIINKFKPDIVVVFGTIAPINLALLSSNSLIIGTERGDPSAYTKFQKLSIKQLFKKADKVVFQTPMARDCYGELVENKAFVIPNPCFLLQSPNEEIESSIREKEIISAGRLVEEKGFDILIRAFKRVHESFPEYKLTIYGDGPERSNLEHLIKELGFNNDDVKLLKGTNRLPEVMKKASMFVLSSYYEGMPNVLLEAMSLGVPIVACDCSPGGAKFLTKNGTIGGPLIPCGNPDVMSETIINMLNNPKKMLELASKGTSVKDELHPDKISKKWMELI